MKQVHSVQNGTLSQRITEREREILTLIADHRSNKEIAASLHLALSTVKWYSQQIFGKLEVRNRREAVQRALELRLLGAGQSKAVPNNLPAPMTAFVGREDETVEIIQLMVKGGTRILTLHGPGGSGKTRLAIQAVSLLVESTPDMFTDGIWFISLTSLQNPASILQTIASTLGYTYFDRGKELLQQLLDYLRQRRFLLILDNFEHLISRKSIHLLTEIITHAPRGKLLITSRTRLGVLGEQSFQVTGMQIPGTDNDVKQNWHTFGAIQLFLDSARRVQPAFEINEENIASVIQICRLVEGMPLGIEMATAWLELFTPQEIVTGIEGNLDFLQVQSSEKRHQSLRVVFRASWNLLSDQEQRCLQVLTVFRGSFTREAAQKISGASRDVFLSLVNKSWLARDAGGRYHIHELLRQYGYENLQQRLAAWREARDAHAHYYAELLHDLGEEMKGFHQVQVFDLTELEFENFRATWIWLTEQGDIHLLIEQMLLGLFLYSEARWRTSDSLQLVRQARKKLDESLADDHTMTYNAILTLAEVVLLTEFFNLRETGSSELLWGKALSPDKVIFAWNALIEKTANDVDGFWLIISAHLYAWPTDPATGLQRLTMLREYFAQNQDLWLQGVAGHSIARIVSGYGYWYRTIHSSLSMEEREERYRELTGILQESLRCFQATGDHWKQAHTLHLLASFEDDSYSQIVLLKQAKELFEEVGDIVTSSLILFDLAEANIRLGNHEGCFQCFHEQKRIFQWLGNRRQLANALSWESIEALRFSSIQHAHQTRMACLAILEEELCSENAQESQSLEVQYAWAVYELGEIERLTGNLDKAQKNYEKSNELFERLDILPGQAFCHSGMGCLALALGEHKTAWQEFETCLLILQSEQHAWLEVCALCGLGRAAIGLGEYEAARDFLTRALSISHVLDNHELFMMVLVNWASLHAAEKRPEQAIELGSFVLHHFAAWNEIKQQAKQVVKESSRSVPLPVARKAKQQGKTRLLEDALRRYPMTKQVE